VELKLLKCALVTSCLTPLAHKAPPVSLRIVCDSLSPSFARNLVVASAARRIWGRWVIQGDSARLFRGVGQGNGVFETERGGRCVVMWVLRSPCLLAEWRDREWVVGMRVDSGRWCRRFLFSLRFDDNRTFGHSIHRVLHIAIKTILSTRFCPACAVKEVVTLMEGKDVVLSSLQLASHGEVGRLLLCRVL
jgi:hypothetical protein